MIKQYPNVLSAIPYLIAKREVDKQSKVQIVTENGLKEFNFDNPNYSVDEYVEFLAKTGIFSLLSDHIINDLTDYVKGVEVGLDTNARKNRTGTAMENLVESYLVKYGFKKNSTYFKEMYASDILLRFGVDVTTVDKKKKANKRFDFVVKSPTCVYGIEVNFYSGGGSKLNETARSFKMIAQESKNIKGFNFIWITDGLGWNSAKNNLEETFNEHPGVFNIHDMQFGELEKVLK